MKNHHAFSTHFFLLPAMFLSLSSCVSLPFEKPNIKKSENIIFQKPQEPFVEIKSKNFDNAWLSKSSGNTISFLSECNNPIDPTIDQIEQDSISGINQIEIIQSDTLTFNQRETKNTTIRGKIDGISIKMQLIVFKKNNCSYTILYGGIETVFDSEYSIFKHFLDTFKVP